MGNTSKLIIYLLQVLAVIKEYCMFSINHKVIRYSP